MAATIGSLTVKLGLVTLEWDKATDKAKAQAKALQGAFYELGENFKTLQGHWKALGGALSVGSIGMAALIQQSIVLTDELSDLAKGFDLSIQEVIAFRQALTGAGASADGAAKIMSTLFSKIDDAKGGNEVVIGQFEKLGISFADLKAMTPYDAIQKVAKGFENVSDSFQKVKLIKEFFGKAGIGLEIGAINDALATGTKKYDGYAESIKKVAVIQDNLKINLENLTIAFTNLIAPFARDGTVSIEKFSATLKGIATTVVVAQFAKLAQTIITVASALRGVTAASLAANLAIGTTSPIGLLIKGASLLAGFAAYKYSMNQSEAGSQSESGIITQADGSPVDSNSENEEAGRKEIDQLNAQIKLTSILAGLERQKLEVAGQANVNGELYTKITEEQITLKEKLANINAKEASDLAGAADKSELVKNKISSLAQLERSRAVNNSRQTIANIKSEATFKNQFDKIEIDALKEKNTYQEDTYNLDLLAVKTKEENVALARLELKYAEDIAAIKRDANIDRLKNPDNKKSIDEKEKQLIKNRSDALRQEIGLTTEKSRKLDVAAAREINYLEQTGKLQLDKLNLENALNMMGDLEKNLAMEKIDWMTTIADLNNQLIDADERSIRVINQKIALENRLHDQRMKNIEDQNKVNQTDAFGKNLAAMGQYSRAAFSMWKAFAISKAIIDTISGARAAFTAFAGIPIVGPALGTAAAAVAIGAGMANVAMIRAQSFQGRAKGGDISGGTPYIVGEKGPELIIPGKSGTVVPNHTLMDAMGGKQNTVVNNYTINAIDTKSFDDRLLASSNTIWAANMYANKGLATGRGRA